jgi:hypothetical protein
VSLDHERPILEPRCACDAGRRATPRHADGAGRAVSCMIKEAKWLLRPPVRRLDQGQCDASGGPRRFM